MKKAVDKAPHTTLIPVTTMEEVAVLSAEQRSKLIASLVDAEQEIAGGRGAPYDSNEMRAHFMRGFEGNTKSSSNA